MQVAGRAIMLLPYIVKCKMYCCCAIIIDCENYEKMLKLFWRKIITDVTHLAFGAKAVLNMLNFKES